MTSTSANDDDDVVGVVTSDMTDSLFDEVSASSGSTQLKPPLVDINNGKKTEDESDKEETPVYALPPGVMFLLGGAVLVGAFIYKSAK